MIEIGIAGGAVLFLAFLLAYIQFMVKIRKKTAPKEPGTIPEIFEEDS